MKRLLTTFTRFGLPFACIALSANSFAQMRTSTDFDLETLQSLSLKDLLNMQVETASRNQQSLLNAPANIKVITSEQIAQRGYQNLIDILRDVPGFDFANHSDAAGEYTSHSINRGIGGTPGNVQLLIMLDGIVQNHIAFNWGQPWGNQQIFADIERIEIVQGPGSASYGANAYSGVVHFITKKAGKESGQVFNAFIGEYGRQSYQFMINHSVADLNFQLAGRYYSSDGDSGLDSYDPAGYFAEIAYPNYLTEQYINGAFVRNTANPLAGLIQQAGYNNHSEDNALRGKLNWQSPDKKNHSITRFALGFNVWEQEQGLASYVSGFEYQTRDTSFKKHHSAAHYYLDLDYRFNDNIELESRIWQRENKQKPQTGFKYSYRYIDLVKSYHSVSTQSAFEQQLNIEQIQNIDWQIGYRIMRSEKMGQIVSLGDYQIGTQASTASDWLAATAGIGLNQYVEYPVEKIDEQALYAQAQGKLNARIDYTLGLRYDHSDAFGGTINPRAAINYYWPLDNTNDNLVFKALYGEAFREPSIFELNDEFRGNDNLEPEEIQTIELVSHYFSEFNQNQLDVKTAIYYSREENRIALGIADTPGGSQYNNLADSDYWGVTVDTNYTFNQSLSAYVNYHYTGGNGVSNTNALDHTANHKVNWGINYTLLPQFNIDLRANHFLDRNAPSSNAYFNQDVPNLSLYNLVLSSNLSFAGLHINPRLIITNLLDKKYTLVGRQDGSSDITEYDVNNNANPSGFTPPYHPQLGRSIALQIELEF